MKKSGKNGSDITLCWDCRHAADPSCPWVGDGKPVDGWNAIPTTIKTGGVITPTVKVLDCPRFERDSFKGGQEDCLLGRKHKVEIDGNDAKNLAAAIIARYADDWRFLNYGELDDLYYCGSQLNRSEILHFFGSQWFGDLLELASPNTDPTTIWADLKITDSMLRRVFRE